MSFILKFERLKLILVKVKNKNIQNRIYISMTKISVYSNLITYKYYFSTKNNILFCTETKIDQSEILPISY